MDQLYGGVSRIFRRTGFSGRGEGLRDNERSASRSIPEGTDEKVGGKQTTLAENVAPHQTAWNDKQESHGLLADIGQSVKKLILGDDDKAEDSTRGSEDFEAEIGKEPEVEAQESSYVEYICTLKGPKHILQQTYIVHVFLGDFDPATNTWCSQSSLVGTFAVFGKALTTGCEKCVRDADAELEVSSTVNLTGALIKEVEEGRLGSVERENVLPYLRWNLHWRVILANGTEQARDEVPHLKVGVISTVVNLPAGGRPEFSGEYVVHTEVTEGRPAGLDPSPTTGTQAGSEGTQVV